MSQIQINKPAEQSQTNVEKEKFEEILNQPTTRMVKLRYSSCCGCGCHDVWIEREVESDDSLKDGDYVRKLLDGDKRIKKPFLW